MNVCNASQLSQSPREGVLGRSGIRAKQTKVALKSSPKERLKRLQAQLIGFPESLHRCNGNPQQYKMHATIVGAHRLSHVIFARARPLTGHKRWLPSFESMVRLDPECPR
jgi:hypothetical protein